jgi:hypothetical protein
MLGLGVMIQSLGGNEETVNAVKSALGKVLRLGEVGEFIPTKAD